MPHIIPGFSNDIQGPFFDGRHGLYHMAFAWHANSSTFGGAPNRWFHIVSKDLARWSVVTTSLDTAMLKPTNITDSSGKKYCSRKPTTGSVTIVNNIPTALFSCEGEEGTVIAKAVPANLSDPLLTNWTMRDPSNPVMRFPTGKGGRDPATAWRCKDGLWRTISACEANCSEDPRLSSAAALWSSPDFETWRFAGTLFGFEKNEVECPEFYEIFQKNSTTHTPRPGSLVSPKLHMLKGSYTAREIAFVGTYDVARQKLVDLVGPAEVSGGQLMDGSNVYASKSFWDPQHQQRVWSGWVKAEWLANVSVTGTHTLPRALWWDSDLRRIVTPPVPQLELLRGKPLVSISKRTIPAVNSSAPLPLVPLLGVEGMQIEVQSTWALPLAVHGPVSFGIAFRLSADQEQRSDCLVLFTAEGNATLQTVVTNRAAIVDVDHKRQVLPLPLKPGETTVTLHCFIDHSVLEAYGGGGRAAVTARTYPLDTAVGTAVWAQGADATLISLQAWQVDTIWVDNVLNS